MDSSLNEIEEKAKGWRALRAARIAFRRLDAGRLERSCVGEGHPDSGTDRIYMRGEKDPKKERKLGIDEPVQKY